MTHRLVKFSAALTCGLMLGRGLEARGGQATEASSDLTVQPTTQTAAQLQELVAPIALYPDVLVAQILAAATYPDQVVEADRWLQDQSDPKNDQLAAELDKQPWDSAVKAVAEFPAVLGNMDKNLAWTSTLGDAYANQPQDVMTAVQSMRQLAQKAGNLQSSDQQTVNTQGQAIAIEPTNSEVVYVPQYDPWMVYGAPIAPWPGWYPDPGLYWGSPGIGFGLGFDVGFYGGFGWGWHHWGADWHHGGVVYNHNTYVSHSSTVINRRVMATRPAGTFHAGDARPTMRSGAFGGFNRGGTIRSFGARGRASFGGGFHGGGGGRR